MHFCIHLYTKKGICGVGRSIKSLLHILFLMRFVCFVGVLAIPGQLQNESPIPKVSQPLQYSREVNHCLLLFAGTLMVVLGS